MGMNTLIVMIKRKCKTELSKLSVTSAGLVVTKPSLWSFRAVVIRL